jgi:hypothetical protein
MEQIDLLKKSLKLSAENITYAANFHTDGENGLLLTSVADTLKAMLPMLDYIDAKFEIEKGIKNKCFSFLGEKNLLNEFYTSK